MTDDIFGNLATRPGVNTCDDLIGDVLAPAGTASCAFEGEFTNPAPATQTNTATVVATDQFGLTATDSDDPVVTVAGSRMADFDANGTTDIAVWRESTGQWFIQCQFTQSWGLTNDVPVAGDYDGNGTDDIATWRPSTGQWFVLGGSTILWGVPGDMPVQGDCDGNGTADRVVYRDGQWLFQATGVSVFWGLAGDIPAPLPPPIYLAFFD